MKQYLVGAIMVAAFATPALAADFYLAADLASGKCMVMTSTPNSEGLQVSDSFAGLRTSLLGPFLFSINWPAEFDAIGLRSAASSVFL
jgi:hypothetical protein